MPQRDSIHGIIRQALINDGWEITDDPFVVSYGERFLFVDFGATEVIELPGPIAQIIGAERGGRRIAVEAKDFRGVSVIADLEQAIGQYVLYSLLLDEVDPEREIYVAVTDVIYDEFFSEPIGELVIDALPLRMVVVDAEAMEVRRWIR